MFWGPVSAGFNPANWSLKVLRAIRRYCAPRVASLSCYRESRSGSLRTGAGRSEGFKAMFASCLIGRRRKASKALSHHPARLQIGGLSKATAAQLGKQNLDVSGLQMLSQGLSTAYGSVLTINIVYS